MHKMQMPRNHRMGGTMKRGHAMMGGKKHMKKSMKMMMAGKKRRSMKMMMAGKKRRSMKMKMAGKKHMKKSMKKMGGKKKCSMKMMGGSASSRMMGGATPLWLNASPLQRALGAGEGGRRRRRMSMKH